MNAANLDLSLKLMSLDSPDFEQPINEVIQALKQVKTHIQGDLKTHLQKVSDDEKETLLKV